MKRMAEKSAPARMPRQAYGGRYCCVTGCHNNTYRDVPLGIRFHVFPKDVARRWQWIKAINRAEPNNPAKLWEPKGQDLVCSVHFVGNKKSNDPKSSSYFPSIFPTHTVPVGESDRAKRKEAREERKGQSHLGAAGTSGQWELL